MVEFRVGKDLELVGHTQVAAVGGIGRMRSPVAPVAYLLLGKRVTHLVFVGRLARPAVALQHGTRWGIELLKH
jgi:hypothetical protein